MKTYICQEFLEFSRDTLAGNIAFLERIGAANAENAELKRTIADLEGQVLRLKAEIARLETRDRSPHWEQRPVIGYNVLPG